MLRGSSVKAKDYHERNTRHLRGGVSMSDFMHSKMNSSGVQTCMTTATNAKVKQHLNTY